VCDWEFAADEEGAVVDDGGLDPEGPFDVDEEGELTCGDVCVVSCPRCTRQLEVGGPDVVCCPGCGHRFEVPQVVPSEARPGLRTWEEDEDEYAEDYGLLCPACHDLGDYDGPGFLPLEDGWVACEVCGWQFHSAELFEDMLQVEREESAYCRQHGRVRCVAAADGSGEFKSVSAAVDHVCDGGLVLVRPGTYRDGVRAVSRRVTIQGDGPVEEIRLCGGPTVRGGRVTLRGVTLLRPLHLDNGTARLDQCVVRCEDGPGVEAVGGWARARLRGCQVTACRGAGVLVTGGASARVADSVLAGNAEGGVRVENESWARLRGCQVTGNGGAGVLVRPNNAAFLHRCVIADNAGPGVAVQGGRALLNRCRVLGQDRAGVLAGAGSRLLLSGCQVCDGRSHGLALGRRVRALTVRCVISGNEGAGARVGPQTCAVLRGCRIESNATGIRLAASATLAWRGSACRNNRGADLDASPGGRLRLLSPRAGDRPG
jgi:hypothetical protein